jgi:hypothetical protein
MVYSLARGQSRNDVWTQLDECQYHPSKAEIPNHAWHKHAQYANVHDVGV